jgi:hypothetical protein
MRKDSTSKRQRAPKKTAPTTDRYQLQAQRFIKLYFGRDTPAFVRDLLQSWLTQLESRTQVFFNHREIAEVALPLMLRKAERMGIDVENPESSLCIDALHESTTLNESQAEYEPPSVAERLVSELEADAEAIARIINSPRTPERIKGALSDALLEVTDGFNFAPDVIRAQYSLAVLNDLRAQGNRQLSGE